jgi:hypothetical protein
MPLVCYTPLDLLTKTVHACDYCMSKGSDVKTIYAAEMWAGIQACETHAEWARRDVRAWWHSQGWVLIEHVLELCPEIAAIPEKTVVWVHYTKQSRDDGSIPRSTVGEMVFLRKSMDYRMPVYTHGVYHGHAFIHLDELQKLGVSRECIERLEAKISTGFYKDEFEAYLLALEKEKERTSS